MYYAYTTSKVYSFLGKLAKNLCRETNDGLGNRFAAVAVKVVLVLYVYSNTEDCLAFSENYTT